MKYLKRYNESVRDEIESLSNKFESDRNTLLNTYRKKLDDCLLYLTDQYKVKVNSRPDYDIDYFYCIITVDNLKQLTVDDLIDDLSRTFNRIEHDMDCKIEEVKFKGYRQKDGYGGVYHPDIKSNSISGILDSIKKHTTENIDDFEEIVISFSVI